MKKKAFTLIEVLITLGIIGVIAALVLPSITNMSANRDKTTALSIIHDIHNTTLDLLNDPTYYSDSVNGAGNVIAGLADSNPPNDNTFIQNMQDANIRTDDANFARNKLNNLLVFRLEKRAAKNYSNQADGTIENFQPRLGVNCTLNGQVVDNQLTETITIQLPSGDCIFTIDNYGNLHGTDNLINTNQWLREQLNLTNRGQNNN